MISHILKNNFARRISGRIIIHARFKNSRCQIQTRKNIDVIFFSPQKKPPNKNSHFSLELNFNSACHQVTQQKFFWIIWKNETTQQKNMMS